jgi:hypothetical protein
MGAGSRSSEEVAEPVNIASPLAFLWRNEITSNPEAGRRSSIVRGFGSKARAKLLNYSA